MKIKQDISIILLAGGISSRFGSTTPKQFLPICGQPLALHSYLLFSHLPEIAEIIVVCAPQYQSLFQLPSLTISLKFALPGNRRQDSVYNGFQVVNQDCRLVCVHDSARPLITKPLVQRVVAAAREHGAATAGMPIKFTIKQADHHDFVCNTPKRSNIWEIQTPQIIKTQWFKKGFHYVNQHQLNVTDDVSIVEQLGMPVKIVKGTDQNLKITTPEDFYLAEKLLNTKECAFWSKTPVNKDI